MRSRRKSICQTRTLLLILSRMLRVIPRSRECCSCEAKEFPESSLFAGTTLQYKRSTVPTFDIQFFTNHSTSQTTNSQSSRMKLLIAFAVLCVIACAAQTNNFGGGRSVGKSGPPLFKHRFRREPFRREPWVPNNGGRPPIRIPGTPPFNPRYRRSPQGSVVLQGTQPLSGPNRQPSLDLNYNHRIIDNDRTKLDAFGGANLQNGHLTPQAGFGVEHRFKNDIFIHGQGQVQPRPGGGFEPSFGAGLGWRFRREAEPYEEEEAAEEIEPCSAC